MRFFISTLLASMVALLVPLTVSATVVQEPAPPPRPDVDPIRIIQYVEGNYLRRQYPFALPSLLKEIRDSTTATVDLDPIFIDSFDDPALTRNAIIYVNYADRGDWNLPQGERHRLRQFLERGGFLYIDAGINSEFLRGHAVLGQRHSFADWEVSPDIAKLFGDLFPEEVFVPLARDHAIFRIVYQGLPDSASLPEATREFVVNEKWPQGTYSLLGLHIEDRLAALASPIMAMGWGRDTAGNWVNYISFRIRESAQGLDERLRLAAYSGERYDATREDGLKDMIYCQEPGLPSWAHEPTDRWRIFRYYSSKEISDYANLFYTRLGVNIFLYALTH